MGEVQSAPEEIVLYGVEGEDGRDLFIALHPNHEVLLVYLKNEPTYAEVVKAQWLGTFGTHYFSMLWRMHGPGTGPFGFRIYPAGTRPVHMESTVIQKNMKGNGSPTFPDVGDTGYPIILFAEDALRFEGMWLQRYNIPPGFIETFESFVSGESE